MGRCVCGRCCTLRIRSVAPQNERKSRRLFAMAISFAFVILCNSLFNTIYTYLIGPGVVDAFHNE